MTTKLALLLCLLVTACIAPEDSDEPAVSEVEQHTTPSVTNYCYTSGSTTWCQDFYTAKWCTSGGYAYGYDYTGCRWSGWNSDNVYCTNGWQWDGNQTHRHCS